MKLTKQSKLLMDFFKNNKCIGYSTQNKRTTEVLLLLYNNIIEANHFIQDKKQKEGNAFYKIKINKIMNVRQIPKPKLFTVNSFPEEVRLHIDEYIDWEIIYTFSLLDREITIHFLLEEENPYKYIEKYNNYIDKILVWFFIVNKHALKKCSRKLVVYIYSTELTKKLPKSNIDILDQIHVNTAFTYSCIEHSNEIVIFRKEEWLKVLIHESFHNFGLDFSDMNTSECNKRILAIFKIDSQVNLFEAYTEFWAEIINVCFTVFYLLKKKQNIDDVSKEDFVKNCYFLIDIEINFKFFQMCKTLDFMGLEYRDLYSNTHHSSIARNTLYKEKSNILSYYILTTIMMYNYQDFFNWCRINNSSSLLQFNRSKNGLEEFCNFIEKHYKTTHILYAFDCMQIFFHKTKTNGKNGIKKSFLMNNMRMSICELE
jgi:hypothetical protein